MQLSRPLWVVLTVACALILLVSNVINSSTSGSSSEQAQKTYSRRRDLHIENKHAKPSLPASTVQAFVGVFTATKPERRHAVRSTWFPSSEADLARLEADTKIRLRFVVGILQDPAAQAALEEEQRVHQDFLVVQVQETYENLVLKVYTFLQDVQATYNPAFIIKTDDDLYIRPDRLAQAIPQWLERGSGYIGVMRAGTDAHDMTNSPWYEPLGVLHNKKYYMYASGGMYALSSEAAQLLTQVPLSQRRLSGGGDDTSIGLWVMGYNIPYLDDRRLGVYYDKGACPDDFVVLTGGATDCVMLWRQLQNCTKTQTAPKLSPQICL